jgi:hypothetical protein
MKPIYLQLDELGPWMKMTTPPISPRRRVFTSAVHHSNNRRVRTVYVNSAVNKELSQDGDLLKCLPEPTIRELPIIDLSPKPQIKPRNPAKLIDGALTGPIQFHNEFIADSPHVTHQYFPYRETAVNVFQKSFRPLPNKNVYPTVKKKRNFSLSPNTKKNYVFWNQRKLVAVKCKKLSI